MAIDLPTACRWLCEAFCHATCRQPPCPTIQKDLWRRRPLVGWRKVQNRAHMRRLLIQQKGQLHLFSAPTAPHYDELVCVETDTAKLPEHALRTYSLFSCEAHLLHFVRHRLVVIAVLGCWV